MSLSSDRVRHAAHEERLHPEPRDIGGERVGRGRDGGFVRRFENARQQRGVAGRVPEEARPREHEMHGAADGIGSVSGSYQLKRRCPSPCQRRRAAALIVCIATPRAWQSAISASTSAAYSGTAHMVTL